MFHVFFHDDHLGVFQPLTCGAPHRLVHEKVKAMFSNFTINAHPMAIMVPCRMSTADGCSPVVHGTSQLHGLKIMSYDYGILWIVLLIIRHCNSILSVRIEYRYKKINQGRTGMIQVSSLFCGDVYRVTNVSGLELPAGKFWPMKIESGWYCIISIC